MKKYGIAWMCVLAVFTSVVIQDGKTCLQAKSKVKINETKYEIYVGSRKKISVKTKKCKFQSSNKKILKVNKKGVLHGRRVGTAKVYVTKKGYRRAVCKVKVGKYVSNLKLKSADTVILYPGGETIIRTQVTPQKALNLQVEYRSSDEKIACVSSEGKIQGVTPGITTITVGTKGITKKKKKLEKNITVVVMEEKMEKPIPTQKPSLKPIIPTIVNPSESFRPTASPLETLPPTLSPDETFIPSATEIASPLPIVTSEPPIETDFPTPEPTVPPIVVPTPPVMPTVEPTSLPVATATPEPTLYPGSVPNTQMVASYFLCTNQNEELYTVYLLNKSYEGTFGFVFNGKSWSFGGSVRNGLEGLQTIIAYTKTSGDGTIKVAKKSSNDYWEMTDNTVGQTYQLQAFMDDPFFGSPYGVVMVKGDTREVIQFS